MTGHLEFRRDVIGGLVSLLAGSATETDPRLTFGGKDVSVLEECRARLVGSGAWSQERFDMVVTLACERAHELVKREQAAVEAAAAYLASHPDKPFTAQLSQQAAAVEECIRNAWSGNARARLDPPDKGEDRYPGDQRRPPN